MAKHKPGTVWPLRMPAPGEPGIVVRTHDETAVRIDQWNSDGWLVGQTILTRRDARLLARRINECLDATTNKPKRKDNRG